MSVLTVLKTGDAKLSCQLWLNSSDEQDKNKNTAINSVFYVTKRKQQYLPLLPKLLMQKNNNTLYQVFGHGGDKAIEVISGRE